MNRLKNAEWRSDTPIVELIGEDGSRIAVSPDQLQRLRDELDRRFAPKSKPVASGWSEHKLLPVQTFQAGLTETTDGEKVALILDPGLPTEVTYCFDAQLSGQLAELLLSLHQTAKGPPTKQ